MRSPGGASDAPPAPRDASEPREADAHVERSPALDPDGHATDSPPRKGKRRGKRGGVRAGAAPASAADVAETLDADAAPLARACADDDRATEPETRESETGAATAKNPVSPVAPSGALSVAAGVEAREAGRSPATPALSLARRDRGHSVSPPTVPDATADAPTSGEGYETSEEVQKKNHRGSVEDASAEDSDVDVADEREETQKQTASAPAWIEPPTAPSFDAKSLPAEIQSLDMHSDPRTSDVFDAPRARVDEDDDETSDATRKKEKKTVAETSPATDAISREDETPEFEHEFERTEFESKSESAIPFPSAREGVTPNNVVSVSAYDGKRKQRLVLVPEHKVGLVLGRGGAHAAYFQHHSGAAIHVARDPGEVPGAGITIFEVPPESDEDDEDEDEVEVETEVDDATRPSSTRLGVSSKKRRAPKPAVDAAHRRRIHLLGSEPATAAAAAMIARLVETSSHRLDRASAETLRRRRESFLPNDGVPSGSLPLHGDTNSGSPSLCLDLSLDHRLARSRRGSRPGSVPPPIGFAELKTDRSYDPVAARAAKDSFLAAAVASDDSSADPILESPQTVKTMRVPHKRVGLIIGRRGENVRFLQDLTRAHIQVQPERELQPGQTHRFVTLRGAESAVAEAARAVEDMCAGKTRVGSARVIPPQPFAVDASTGDVPGTNVPGMYPGTYPGTEGSFGALTSEPFLSGGGTYDVRSDESYGSYASYGAPWDQNGFAATRYSQNYETWHPYVPALPWHSDDMSHENAAYAYYAYAASHAPYAYAPTSYAYGAHFVDPRFAGFAYVPGYVPGCVPGTSPDVPDASGTPPATASDFVPETLPRDEFPTPGEWHRSAVPAVSVLQPDVEFPGDAASVPETNCSYAPGTAFGDGDDPASRRRRHGLSGERRRGGKSRRGGKGRPSSSSSSERASSLETRFARDGAFTSSRADDVNAQTRPPRGGRETSLISDETRDTKLHAVTVSFPASPESGVGTGVFTVEPP